MKSMLWVLAITGVLAMAPGLGWANDQAASASSVSPNSRQEEHTAVGSPPHIASFKATPASVAKGQKSTLSWSVSGATTLLINQGIGRVRGTSISVSPTKTTTYTLTAINANGSKSAQAKVTVTNAPVISSFSANPSTIARGKISTLKWVVSGASSLTIDQGVGAVQGTWKNVNPSATTTYTLTASNASGSTSAKTTITVGDLPVIDAFVAVPATVATGGTTTLGWSTTGATSLSIDNGVGIVTGTSVKVQVPGKTTYTLTASNAVGNVKASVKVDCIPLVSVNDSLLYSEHCVYIIPSAGQVTWTGDDSYDSVYSVSNVNSYVATLKSIFPDDYFFVVVTAGNLNPPRVPNVLTYRHIADGIGEDTIKGVGVPNICRYHYMYTPIDGIYGVLDHEIGHNWGVFIGSEVGTGHWLANSTATGQMASVYSDDGYATVKMIAGDPASGFTWTSVDNLKKNETDVFSEQDLYLQGLSPTFPVLYVLDSPVYNADHTVSYSSVSAYDQNWVEQRNGVRSPSYQTSDKKFRLGFVYIARDITEVRNACVPVERSINHFTNAEQVDAKNFRFQVPFLVETHYRASINTLLTDLDGNSTPVLNIVGPTYMVSTDGNALVPFSAQDPGGAATVVSCVPASLECSIKNGNVNLSGLDPGTHFFTIKAENAGGKKAFAHFVIDRE